ncbi:hypothetical protein DSO57_1018046 [Entomophthora muscae]|uniref:Uncharacterized protein n=2 Tax=Entomophthora muscae TaxID=34485 RepID=A0ACC2UQS1_9FUNG|nr:hypothetical protein DSO57_1031265 [Entomophthora muscae]KAJ9088936.1 hypothetical protein DSO57_1018046 [Entomophthora muscae]
MQPLFEPIKYDPHAQKRRHKASFSQHLALESTFLIVPKPLRVTQEQLAAQLGMSLRSVQIWFQNRRAKQRAKYHAKPKPLPCAVPEFSIAYLTGHIPQENPSQKQ